jgi:hypothetical protein
VITELEKEQALVRYQRRYAISIGLDGKQCYYIVVGVLTFYKGYNVPVTAQMITSYERGIWECALVE